MTTGTDFPAYTRIAIVGAGAIGLLYGGRLASRGFDVHFLLRRDYPVVRQRGVTVQSIDGDFQLAPSELFIYDDVRKMPKADLVIVTMKTTDNDRLFELLPPLLHEKTTVLTLQNGLGVEDDLEAKFGAERIVGGIAFVCCNRTDPGVVQHTREGLIRIGEFVGPSTWRTLCLSHLLIDGGTDCTVLENLRTGRFEKLVWNIPFNGLGALLDMTTDQLLAKHRDRVISLMGEVLAIAKADGIDISPDLPAKLVRMTELMGPYKTSMQVDRNLGRPMEVESIIGRPLAVAREKGVRAPELEKLHSGLISLPA